MKQKLLQYFKSTYIFNIIAVFLLIGIFVVYATFETTKKDIISINNKGNIEYIDNVTQNIAKDIKNHLKDNFHNKLKNDEKLIKELEQKLRYFVTTRYRYIYVVDRSPLDNKEYRFLLDGAINPEDKSLFDETFIPLNSIKWKQVYKTKKAVVFGHKEIKSLWMTYLKPIIINNKVEAIIVIDFSLNEHNLIKSSLDNLKELFDRSIFFIIFVFFIIIIFSYIDRKREQQKDQLYKKLQEKTEELYEESAKVHDLNKNLEDRVKEEVLKNREKDNQLLHQSRLAQMGEMISMIAHQWRQPLAAISSTSSAINIKAQLGTTTEEFLIENTDSISEYTNHLSATIDDFRNFFKSNKEKHETNFSELINSVKGIIKISIDNKKIELIEELNCNDKFITYSNEIKQVILNLIKNAEDILVEKEIKEPFIKIETSKEDNCLHLKVSDNGGGIPESIIDKIFDPYFSTKTKKDGTGLGLYMSKTIIEDHCGGELIVNNTKHGAQFTIKIKESSYV